ncbi:MAG: rRNA methyltransferase [Actinobacteria bacterium]|nr:rRNA methyltransferase [Actinomycetota bacterium]
MAAHILFYERAGRILTVTGLGGATADAVSVGTVGGSEAAGELATAIRAALAGTGRAVTTLSASTHRLMTAYRSGEVPAAPLLTTRADAAAYAAYRMPATAAAAVLALQETRLSLPDWAPATHLDFGAGTGSMAWAVASTLPSVAVMTLLEQSAEAIRLGQSILGSTTLPALRTATWKSWQLASERAPSSPGRSPDGLVAADLATACYLLGELTTTQQEALVALAARTAPVVVLVEPGTPAGHRRILAAREQLLAAGFLVAAPCPHQLSCPEAARGDWCHFGARLQRSGLHRQIKGGDLGYEDEKFSYVAAARPDVVGRPDWPAGRIVRRPRQRKGLVTLELCEEDGSVRTELVGKSSGEIYRRARKASWGSRWENRVGR